MLPRNPQSKLFGQSDPALTFSITGLVNNPELGIADNGRFRAFRRAHARPRRECVGRTLRHHPGQPYGQQQLHPWLYAQQSHHHWRCCRASFGFNAWQVIFAGVINNEFYYRPGNFWHISLNPNNADPGFDVMRGTNDLNLRLSRRLNPCDSVLEGGFVKHVIPAAIRER